MSRNQIVIVILVIAAAAIMYAVSIPDASRNVVMTDTSPDRNPASPPALTPPVKLPPQTHADLFISLRDVSGGSSLAEGSRKLVDGIYNVGVRAEKLPSPSLGKYYRAWLIQNAGSYGDALVLDALRLVQDGTNKGSYVLGAQVKEDAWVYKGMIITLQPMSDQKPSNVILEGVFR